MLDMILAMSPTAIAGAIAGLTVVYMHHRAHRAWGMPGPIAVTIVIISAALATVPLAYASGLSKKPPGDFKQDGIGCWWTIIEGEIRPAMMGGTHYCGDAKPVAIYE